MGRGTYFKLSIDNWLGTEESNQMPRKARIDAPGVVHHVIGRGINRQEIFSDKKDYPNFFWSVLVIYWLRQKHLATHGR
jgi:hypothetical protein